MAATLGMTLLGSDLVNFAHGFEGVSRLAATSFVSGLWQGLVLAAGVALCLRLLPKTSAAVRFSIWTAVFAVLALLPLLHAYTLRAGGGVAGHAAVVQVDVRWSFAIAALWLVASLIRAAELGMDVIRLHGIWKRATPVETSFDEALAAAGRRRVQVCTSVDVDRPSVIGFFSPRILLPEDVYARLTGAELEQIVLHEAGHLRRADDWINLWQKVSLVAVPLNPVLLWVERRLCLERELACDDDVLRWTKSPKAYATCLTNLAEHRMNRRVAALSLGAWERRSELARRVHSILRHGEGMGKTQARAVMAGLMLAMVGGAAGLSRCPQFVSFAPMDMGNSSSASVVAMNLAGSLPGAGYQPVVFHPQGAAHESLLKASMPMASANRTALPLRRVVAKRRRTAGALVRSNVSLRSDVLRRSRVQGQGWVVLTSWSAQERSGVVLTVSEERGSSSSNFSSSFSSSYAAVPTQSGWLVIQL
ncbi:M56 family metallopeptidase [Granulicella sp. L60]|uniref:M56 family metallopeptidase n=1 Tax=Granulicella sp. L60 TaxID=1641866 RepID=UPI00131ADA25|nr:M56 family metallopeptidase [Granulicella sp. L60]